jgi:hypothetical protein
MKKFQFLLLDAGPIIKLFSLGMWDEFLKHCDVTISRIIAEDQVLYTEDGCQHIDLNSYEKQNHIKFLDVGPDIAKRFHDKFNPLYKAIIHDGEKETLAFLCSASEAWQICASDGAVFRVLGLLGKGTQGISLEEILTEIGLSRKLEWQFTKKFREVYTQKGQIDATQGQGLL